MGETCSPSSATSSASSVIRNIASKGIDSPDTGDEILENIPWVDGKFLKESPLKSYTTVARGGQRGITTGVAVLILKGRRAQRSVLGHLRRSSWNNLTLALNVCILCHLVVVVS